MKYYPTIFFAALCAHLCLFHCFRQDTAGVISETTNGARLAGRLFDADGAPLSNTLVTLHSIESCSNCSLHFERVTLSNHGTYVFDSVPAGTYVIYATSIDSQAAALTISIPHDSGEVNATDLKISNTVTKNGVITAPSEVYPLTVSVCGTTIAVVTDLMGRYSLSRLPKAEFLFRFSSGSQTIRPFVVPSALIVVADTVIYDTTGRTILDNFDDGDGFHILSPFLGTGRWYERHESSMIVSPMVLPDDLSAAITTEGAWRKKSLVLSISGTSGGLFIIACELGKGLGRFDDTHRWFDLSGMTALTFAARGEGTVHVAFLTRKMYTEYSGADHFEKIITLSKEWTSYRIETTDLAPPEGSDAAGNGENWKDAAAYVAEISFFSDNAGVIGLDDLCIEGVNSLDLITSGTGR